MSIQYFDRYSGKLETEEVYGGDWVRFVYGSSLGWPLAFLIARRRWFARAYGAWMRRAASRRLVAPFIDRFGIDASEMEKAPEDFESFNDFFVRALRASSRPIDPDPGDATIASYNRSWTISPDSPEVGMISLSVQVSWVDGVTVIQGLKADL